MEKSILLSAAEGALGGLLGTTLMHGALRVGSRMPPSLQQRTKGNPAAFIASRAPVPARARPLVERTAPWLYGVSWPTLFGFLAPMLGVRGARRTLAAGAGLGATVWAVGHLGWLPAVGLEEPIHRQPVGATLLGLATHVLYGVAAALPLALYAPRSTRLRRLFHF